MEEEETLDLSRETVRKSQTVTHLIEATHLTEANHVTEATHQTEATHLGMSSTLSPTIACPLLSDQKGDMVVDQEEKEKQDTTDKAQKTIAETNADAPDFRVDKNRGKRAREETSRTTLDAKKKR